MSERDGEHQRENSPKQTCSWWFVLYCWIVLVVRIPTFGRALPPPYDKTLTLPVSIFCSGSRELLCFLGPHLRPWLSFSRHAFWQLCAFFLFLISFLFSFSQYKYYCLFQNGFLHCDHVLLSLDNRLLWEFNIKLTARATRGVLSSGDSSNESCFDIFSIIDWFIRGNNPEISLPLTPPGGRISSACCCSNSSRWSLVVYFGRKPVPLPFAFHHF